MGFPFHSRKTMDKQGLLQKFNELGKRSLPILATVTAISLALGLASTRYRVVPKDEADEATAHEADAVETAEREAKPKQSEKAEHEAKAESEEKSEHAAKAGHAEKSEHADKADAARKPAHAEETVAAIHPRPKKGWFRSLID